MNKKVNVLIILSFLFILILGGSYAYSKYRSETSGTAKADIANWNIKVNGCNVVNPEELNSACFESNGVDENGNVLISKNFSITDFTYNNKGNQFVVDNKIAPGSTGTFPIVIEPMDTEVSFTYDLIISLPAKSVNKSIRIYIKDVNDTNYTELIGEEIVDGNGTVTHYNYTSSYLLEYNDFKNDSDFKKEYIVMVDWIDEIDDDTNKKDTEIGVDGSDPKLNIPINIEFEQYKG